jgi:hypothetical protein
MPPSDLKAVLQLPVALEKAIAKDDHGQIMAICSHWTSATTKSLETGSLGILTEIRGILTPKWWTKEPADEPVEDEDDFPQETRERMKKAMQTALLPAVRYGHVLLASFLLEQGAEVTEDVVTYAHLKGSCDVFQAMLDHGWNINTKLSYGQTSLK